MIWLKWVIVTFCFLKYVFCLLEVSQSLQLEGKYEAWTLLLSTTTYTKVISMFFIYILIESDMFD